MFDAATRGQEALALAAKVPGWQVLACSLFEITTFQHCCCAAYIHAAVQTPQMCSLQAFRCTLAALPAASGSAAVAAHLSTSPCAILDTSGHVNILATTPASAWAVLLVAASTTLTNLSGPMALTGASMPSIFPPPQQRGALFDATLTLRLPCTETSDHELLSTDLPHSSTVALRVERLLVRALGTRIVRVMVFAPVAAATPAGKEGLPGVQGHDWLCIGLIFDRKEVRAQS